MRLRRILGAVVLPLFVFLSYLVMYVPIIVLVLFSFNSGHTSHQWQGFTLDWYRELFQSVEIVDALKNSLVVAFSAVGLSVIMGLLFVFYGGLHHQNDWNSFIWVQREVKRL